MDFEQQMKDAHGYIHFLTLCLERCWGQSLIHYAHILQEESRDDSKYCMYGRNQWSKMVVKHEWDEKKMPLFHKLK